MNEVAWYIGTLAGILFILGTLNVWFLIRLVKKIDESADAVLTLQTEFKTEMRHVSEKIQDLGSLNERLAVVEKDVAVLQYVAKRHHPETIKGRRGCDNS